MSSDCSGFRRSSSRWTCSQISWDGEERGCACWDVRQERSFEWSRLCTSSIGDWVEEQLPLIWLWLSVRLTEGGLDSFTRDGVDDGWESPSRDTVKNSIWGPFWVVGRSRAWLMALTDRLANCTFAARLWSFKDKSEAGLCWGLGLSDSDSRFGGSLPMSPGMEPVRKGLFLLKYFLPTLGVLLVGGSLLAVVWGCIAERWANKFVVFPA